MLSPPHLDGINLPELTLGLRFTPLDPSRGLTPRRASVVKMATDVDMDADIEIDFNLEADVDPEVARLQAEAAEINAVCA